jgi:hypothetical protein
MMQIPEETRRFISETFDSVIKLEMLLLMRSEPQRTWSPGDIASTLQVSSDMIRVPLADLQARGLLTTDTSSPEAYRFAPVTAELNAQVDAVADVYRARRVAVVTLIYSLPLDRVKSFADAFRLRKES